MAAKVCLVIFVVIFAITDGLQPTNYELSRNRVGGFGLKEIKDFFLGAGYGQYPYPGNYPNYPSGPSGPSGPGLYPGGNYPGQYPGSNYPSHNPGAVGPPGAHPGCPLCDSSVYSYCSHKQAHDACCCENPAYIPFNCRKTDCKYIYANSCQEYNLIAGCCCVDLQKNAVEPNVVG